MLTGHGPSDASRRTLPAPPRPAAAFQRTAAARAAADCAATPLGRGIDPMQREHSLGRVDGNAFNLGHGRSPVRVFDSRTYGTRCRGAVHPNGKAQRIPPNRRVKRRMTLRSSALPAVTAMSYRNARSGITVTV